MEPRRLGNELLPFNEVFKTNHAEPFLLWVATNPRPRYVVGSPYQFSKTSIVWLFPTIIEDKEVLSDHVKMTVFVVYHPGK